LFLTTNLFNYERTVVFRNDGKNYYLAYVPVVKKKNRTDFNEEKNTHFFNEIRTGAGTIWKFE